MPTLQASIRAALASQELAQLSSEGLTASFGGLPPLSGFSQLRAPFTYGYSDVADYDQPASAGRDIEVDVERAYTINRWLLVGFISSDEANLSVLEAEASDRWMDAYLATILAHQGLGVPGCSAKLLTSSSFRWTLYGRDCWVVRNRVLVHGSGMVYVNN
jgi:hypothetical protein